MSIGVRIEGQRRVALRFEKFPSEALDKLTEVVSSYQQKLASLVSDKIRSRTGKLAASQTGGIEQTPNRVRGWVNLAGRDRALILQAVALEYGSHTKVNVSAHAGKTLRTVYGHYISPMQVIVGSYDRQTNIVAQRLLRDPLASISKDFLEDAEAAVVAATKED